MPKLEDDKLAKQYLLGELSESELGKVEEEYFEDDEAFERLNAVEDELIDAYALGQLSLAERKRFEQRLLLSPVQRERVKFSRTLLRTASGAHQIESNIPPLKRTASWWTSPFNFLQTLNPVLSLSAAAVLILAVLAGWWLIQRNNLRQEQEAQRTNTPPDKRIQAGNDNAKPTQQTSEAPRPTNQSEGQKPSERPTSSNRIVTFALTEGLVRDLGQSNRLVIPENTGLVRLRISVQQNDYKAYHADLRKTEGDEVWHRSGIRLESVISGKGTIVLPVAAGILKNGDYILTLSGAAPGRTEIVGEYSFRVVRN
jgi:hypothetical protein